MRLAGLHWVSPHALRHACGFTLANKGTDTRTIQAYLGHRNIQHTVCYTELAPGRFKGLFSDWQSSADALASVLTIVTAMRSPSTNRGATGPLTASTYE